MHILWPTLISPPPRHLTLAPLVFVGRPSEITNIPQYSHHCRASADIKRTQQFSDGTLGQSIVSISDPALHKRVVNATKATKTTRLNYIRT